MALTAQQQNFISRLQTLSLKLVADEQEIDAAKADWDLNGFSGMVDGDIQAAFPGLTLAKVTAAVTAITAIQTANGSFASGNLGNLEKMKT